MKHLVWFTPILAGLVLAGRLDLLYLFLLTAVAFAIIALLPGWLCLALMADRFPVPIAESAPLAFVTSLGLLSPFAVLLLALEAKLIHFLLVAAVLTLGLIVIWVVKKRSGKTAVIATPLPPFSYPLLLVTLILATAVFFVYWHTTSIRDAGDHWFYLHFIRQYQSDHLLANLNPLAGKTATTSTTARAALNGWWVIQAALIQITGQPLMPVYWLTLPPLLMGMALLAFYTLARQLFQNINLALGAVCLQIVFLFSTIHSHDWAGYAFFLRISEDKYLVWFVLLPVAFYLLLRFVQKRARALFLFSGLAFSALGFTHPFGLGLWSAAAIPFLVVVALKNGRKGSWRGLLLIGGGLSLVLLLMRGLFVSQDQVSLIYGATAQQLPNNTHIYLLSAIENRYIAHPHLVAHPLILGAVLLTPLLIWRRAANTNGLFLFIATLVPLAILYNPITAPLLGRLIPPLLIWRLVWLLPTALTLTYAGHQLWRWLPLPPSIRRQNGRFLWPVVTLLLLLLTGLLAHDIQEGWLVLHDYQSRSLRATERELLSRLDAQLPAGTTILADPLLNTHIPGFMSTADLLTFRIFEATPTAADELVHFYTIQQVEPALLKFLARWQIGAIILPANHPLIFAFNQLPHLFVQHYSNPDYRLYTYHQGAEPGLVLTANGALLRGELPVAIDLYQQALAHTPIDKLALLGLGMAFQAAGQSATAEETFNQLLAMAPTEPAALLALAELYELDGNHAAAMTIYNQLLTAHPNYRLVHEKLGDLFMIEGQKNSAATHYRQSINPDITPDDFQLEWGDLLWQKGLTEAALAAYATVIDTAPDWFIPTDSPSLFAVWGRSFTFDKRAERVTAAMLATGAIHIEQGDMGAATAVYEQLRRFDPTNPTVYEQLRQLYSQAGREDGVTGLYEAAIRLNRNSTWPYLQLGRFYLMGAHSSEAAEPYLAAAIPLLQQAIALDWDHPGAHQLLSAAYQRLGDTTAAITVYEQALDRAPWAAWAEEAIGGIFAQTGAWETAVSHYQAALLLDPTRSGTYNLMVEGYLARGGTRQALTVYEAAARANPTLAWPYAGLGRVYALLGNRPAANESLQTSLAQEPHKAATYITVGNTYRWDLHAPETAVTVYQQAVKLDPERADYLLLLGGALYEAGQLAVANTVLQKAEQLAPEDASIPQLLGDIAFQEQGAAAAQPYYEHALAIDPRHTFALVGLVRVHKDQGDLAAAQQVGQQAVALAVTTHEIAQARYELGLVLLALRDEMALIHLQQALAALPDNGWFHAAVADYYLAVANDPVQAVAYYRQAADLLPQQAILQAAYAAALVDTGQAAAAQPVMTTFLALGEPGAAGYLRLGAALQRANEWAQVITLLESAVAAGVADADVFIQLGDAYRLMGDESRAVVQYEKAAMIDPDHPLLQP